MAPLWKAFVFTFGLIRVCGLHEEVLHRWLSKIRPEKILIRLRIQAHLNLCGAHTPDGTFSDVTAHLTLSLPNFRRHLSSAFNFNKLSLRKKFISKVEHLNVKQRRSR